MTDIQLLTLALAVIIPLSLLIYSNSRITDVRNSIGDAKETLRAEMKTMKLEIVAEIKTLLEARFDKLDGNLGKLEAALKQHEVEHH